MNDPRPYWNDPATRDIALKLIADAGGAVCAMRREGADAETIKDVAWALTGKLRDSRVKLPEIQAGMASLGSC